jgi:hypothetical protein
MKKSLIVLFVALFVVSCASVFAAESQKGSSQPQAKHVMGEVVSVDSASNTLVVRETLKDKSTKEITITCEPGTKIHLAGKTVPLAEIAAGDTVTISYHPAADGKNMAKTVSISKPQKKAEPAGKS